MKEKIQTSSTKAKEFAHENWPSILATTITGATILLLLKYYRSNRESNATDVDETDFQSHEAVAEDSHDETSLLLETALPLLESIPHSQELSHELSEGLDGRAKTVMQTLSKLRSK